MAERTWRLLVIDDDAQTAAVLRAWYRGKPFEVLEADDGREGLRLAQTGEPDAVLLDLRMPDWDGIRVAHALRASAATASLPIVLLTACRDTEDKVAAFEAGADDYVTKPFDCAELDARIRSLLHRRELLLGLHRRVNHLQASNKQLEELVVLDEKTGLANFREFQRRLREEWLRAERYGTQISLVMLDLDDFKRVNDALGHPAGDRVLLEFALLVAGGARATDLAARYGGEEFAVILPHTGGALATRVAERIRAAVEEFVFLLPGREHRQTVSAGVATGPSPATATAQDLVRAADRALYRAKRLGKNRVVMDQRPD